MTYICFRYVLAFLLAFVGPSGSVIAWEFLDVRRVICVIIEKTKCVQDYRVKVEYSMYV